MVNKCCPASSPSDALQQSPGAECQMQERDRSAEEAACRPSLVGGSQCIHFRGDPNFCPHPIKE